MSRRFAYWLLRLFACCALAVLLIVVCLEGFARLAIEDSGSPDDGAASGALRQRAWPADMAASGIVAFAGPDAAASVFSKEQRNAPIRGHSAPVVAARLVRDGRWLIRIRPTPNLRPS